MRFIATLALLHITLVSYNQTINDVELIAKDSFQLLYSNESSPCDRAEFHSNYGKMNQDSSTYHLHLAEQFAERCNDIATRATIRFELGKNLTGTGNHELSLDYLNLALSDFMTLGDTLLVAQTYKAIGVNYKRISKFNDALQSYNSAANYFHLANDHEGIARIDLNIGLILKNMERFDEAKKKYHSALAGFLKLNIIESVADCQNNLGNVFKNEGNYDSAFHYMYLTLSSREKHGPDRKLGYIYHNLANLHNQTNELDSALWYLDKSIVLKSKIGNNVELSSDYTIYGEIYEKQGKQDAAIAAYEKSRILKYDSAVVDTDYKTSLKLAKAYYQQRDYKNSAKNFALYFEQCDIVKIDNDPLAIESQLSSYEFMKDSIEMEKLLIERQLQEAKYRNKQLANESVATRFYFILGLLSLIILMIVLLLISFRKRLVQGKEHRTVLAKQNEELKRTLVSKEEKETLLKEIHHRVKNNLQIISSLIRLQSGYINQFNFQERLNEIENRILSMALVHEKLYQSSDLSRLKVKSYIRDLCINVLESYQSKRDVNFKFDIDKSEYSIDTLIPLGLILNETISNALKHAFQDRNDGLIEVTLKEKEGTDSTNACTILTVKDNGIGADLSVEELKEDSLGMDLIFSLTEQLDGDLSIDMTEGFAYEFTFPKLS